MSISKSDHLQIACLLNPGPGKTSFSKRFFQVYYEPAEDIIGSDILMRLLQNPTFQSNGQFLSVTQAHLDLDALSKISDQTFTLSGATKPADGKFDDVRRLLTILPSSAPEPEYVDVSWTDPRAQGIAGSLTVLLGALLAIILTLMLEIFRPLFLQD